MSTSRLCVVHCLSSAIRLEFTAPGVLRTCAVRRSGEVPQQGRKRGAQGDRYGTNLNRDLAHAELFYACQGLSIC